MTDLVQATDIEPCKENIQPLREGRRSEALKKATTEIKQMVDIEKEKQSFEIRIQNYVGNDPLELWLAYLKWTKETFLSGGQSELISTTERCVQTFLHDPRYKQDGRYLSVILQYADMVRDPLEIFAFMDKALIGVNSALFWKAWGRALEHRKDWAKAEMIYQRGIDMQAKPEEMMKSVQTEFESRMFRRIQAEAKAAMLAANNPAPSDEPEELPETRVPLSTKSSMSSEPAFGQRVAHDSSAKRKRSSDQQLAIYVDEQFACSDERKSRKMAESSVPSVSNDILIGNLASATTSAKENQRLPDRWNLHSMPQDPQALAKANQRVKAVGAVLPNGPIEVYLDPSLASSAQPTRSVSSNALRVRDPSAVSRSEAILSQPLAGHPYRFTIRSEQYPRGSNEPTQTSNGKFEMAAYDRTLVYPGDGKEYSFEEIRAKIYASRALVEDKKEEEEEEEQTNVESDHEMECDVEETVGTPIKISTPVKAIVEPEKFTIFEDSIIQNSHKKGPVTPPRFHCTSSPLIKLRTPVSRLTTPHSKTTITSPRQTEACDSVESEAVVEPLIDGSFKSFEIFQESFADKMSGAVKEMTTDRKPLQPRSVTDLPPTVRSNPPIERVLPVQGLPQNDENSPTMSQNLPAFEIACNEKQEPLEKEEKLGPSIGELQRGLSVFTVGEDPHRPTLKTLAETLGGTQPEESWKYDPSEDTTSVMTIHTRDAMAEVMGLFQFENTVSNLKPVAFYESKDSDMDDPEGVEVTASIVIPHGTLQLPSENNFTIFEEPVMPANNSGRLTIFEDPIAADVQAASSKPVQKKGLGGFTIFQDPIPSNSLAPHASMQQQVPMMPEIMQQAPLMIEPTQPSRLEQLLSHPSSIDEHTSTLNFTLSGITASNITTNIDIDTINTQNLSKLIQQQVTKHTKSISSVYVLPLQHQVPSGTSTVDFSEFLSQKSQADQLKSLIEVGLADDKSLHNCLSEGQAPALIVGQTVSIQDVSFVIKSQPYGSEDMSYLVEDDSGREFILQIGSAHDYLISKRIFSKLSGNLAGRLDADSIEDLQHSIVNYSSAYVFEDVTFLLSSFQTSHHKSTIAQLIALRAVDPKSVEEIVVWYYTSRMLKIMSSLHTLGFIASGKLNPQSFWVSPVSELSAAYRGLCLRDLSGVIDLESFPSDVRFTSNTDSALIKQLSNGEPYTTQADFFSITNIVHNLLHGKDIVIEKEATTGRWKSKVAPKMFWQVSMWLKLFDTLLNATSINSKSLNETVVELTKTFDEHIASKLTALRFQMGKIQL